MVSAQLLKGVRMLNIGKQMFLQIKDLPPNTFFMVPPYADAEPNDRRFTEWHVLIADKDLPPHMRHGDDSDACFRVSEFQPRSGMSVLVWVRETDVFDDEDCAVIVPVKKLMKNGADVCAFGSDEERPEMEPQVSFTIPATRKPRGGRNRGRNDRTRH